ncbi:MAG TPA: hypothetical protein VI358_04465 [Pseudolabrys sp.]
MPLREVRARFVVDCKKLVEFLARSKSLIAVGIAPNALAVYSGMMDMKPGDPVEGILISQLMTANQASLSTYERAWMQPSEYFEARTRYLALADKAARTVALLTERLDHHRGGGQQKIVVQHVTTNNVTADQAVITDSLVTNTPATTGALEVMSDAKPMPTLDVMRERELVGVGEVRNRNERQPHAQSSYRASVQGQIKANVGIESKADMACALHMSAHDPKRTCRFTQCEQSVKKAAARPPFLC